MTEPQSAAIVSLSVYVILSDDEGIRHNVEPFGPTTDDPDSYGDAVLREVNPEPALVWRQSGGDDHGDGLTSFDYIAEVADLETLAAFLRWAGVEAADATPNGGLLTGPEEYGYIPVGASWTLDGMDWNIGGVTRVAGVDVAAFALTLEAAEALELVEEEPSEEG